MLQLNTWSMEETVVFTGVCDSVHRGCVADTPPPGQTHPSGQTSPPGQTHPLGRHPPPGRHPPLGGHPPRDCYCSARYVSYWNAFFLDHCEDFYRPQEYSRKGNFLHLSVILFRGRGHACQERRPLQRTVWILLECILVVAVFRF